MVQSVKDDVPRCRSSSWRDRLKDLLWGIFGRTVGAIIALAATAILVTSGMLDRFVQLLVSLVMPLIPFVI
jgi:hypothetical protein